MKKLAHLLCCIIMVAMVIAVLTLGRGLTSDHGHGDVSVKCSLEATISELKRSRDQELRSHELEMKELKEQLRAMDHVSHWSCNQSVIMIHCHSNKMMIINYIRGSSSYSLTMISCNMKTNSYNMTTSSYMVTRMSYRAS